jgi:hypothetical protein
MRSICWLHISDIHMRVSDAWSQDIVLQAMCADIAEQCKEGTIPDFILATGDLAFSGHVGREILRSCDGRVWCAKGTNILHTRQP